MNPISLPINELKPALTGLGKIINRSSNHPVLNHIKIERTKDGWICLTSTDLDHFITVRMEQPAQGEPVSMLLPYEELVKAVKSSDKGESILITPTSKDVTVLQQNQINSLPTEEFPPVPKIKTDGIPLPGPLRNTIQEALQCASEDPERRIIQGAFIDVSQPKAQHIIATDGRHLYNSNSWNLPFKNSVIIPKHKFLAWSEFNRDGEWQLKVENPMLQINSRRWRFICRQLEGQYPNWRQVLPDPSKVRSNIVIEPPALPKLIQTIEKMPCDNPEHFTIGLEWKDQRLTLLGRHQEWTRVMIPDVKGDGNNVTVFLNRQLLGKALEFGLNCIGIIDSMSPVRLHNGSREMIVMPLNPDMQRNTEPPQPRKKLLRKPRQPQLPSAIDEALNQISSVFTVFKSGLNSLRDLTSQLKGIKRTQKM